MFSGATVITVGTICKEMPNKLSILEEYADDLDEEGEVFREKKKVLANYCSDEDFAILEDETGRIRLSGPCIHPHEWATGAGKPYYLDISHGMFSLLLLLLLLLELLYYF